MPSFIPGLELSRRFYWEAVRPILDRYFSGLPHAAALIGTGSEVLGFDTEMSIDHNWGPRVLIFLRDEDAHLGDDIRDVMAQQLLYEIAGFPVNMIEHAEESGTYFMHATTERPLNHRVLPQTVRGFFQRYLGYDIDQPLQAADWLTFPAQKLRGVTAGAVFEDQVGELTALRERFVWYPRDVWLYILACAWQRIAQEEHLMPRAGFVGDEVGSALIGSRLVRDVMNLCFLMERHYAPYPKWLGTAFRQLACAKQLEPLLWQAQMAATWQEREAALCAAYEFLAYMHNALGITEQLPVVASNFYNRPFKVIHAELFVQALIEQITDPEVKRIAARPLIGSVDQFSDSTDMLSPPSWRAVLRKLYEE